MRVEIKKIQKETGITAIFVTHDQEEALSMSDRIVVMNSGSAEQVGTPEEVYERPATAFVADFLGKANMLAGTVRRSDGPTTIALAAGQTVNVVSPKPLAEGSKVTVVVRPQKLSVGAAAGANRLSGRVVSTSYLGGSAIYEVDIGGKANIRANAAIDGRVLREGEAIELGFDPDDCVLLDEDGRRIS
jgi:spermidine/putrescine transport system ATP-binding protein